MIIRKCFRLIHSECGNASLGRSGGRSRRLHWIEYSFPVRLITSDITVWFFESRIFPPKYEVPKHRQVEVPQGIGQADAEDIVKCPLCWGLYAVVAYDQVLRAIDKMTKECSTTI